MLIRRWIRASLSLVVLCASGNFTTAAAQERTEGRVLFSWSGRVDREVQLSMQGRELDTRLVGHNERTNEEECVRAELPTAPGKVLVRLERGRGSADVVQQPDFSNGFTTVVRIRDPQSGADEYRVSAYWESAYGRGEWGDHNRRDRDHDSWDGDHDGDHDCAYADHGRGDRDGDRGDSDHDGDRDHRRDTGYDDRMHIQPPLGSLHWSGNVDDELLIRVQGRHLEMRDVRGSGTAYVRHVFRGAPLPPRDVQLYLSNAEGRGYVSVLEQPTARNGYTAVVRVKDPQSGSGYYSFDLNWK